jgi:hypothetical protein
MNFVAIILFSVNMLLTIIIMSVIIAFLNQKPMVKKDVQDQIQIDLIRLTLVFVIVYSSLFIVREILGPFGSFYLLKTLLLIIQYVFNMMFNCILSLEFMQLCNFFCLTFMNNWSESKQLIINRIFVFTLGITIGSSYCYLGLGFCRKTSVYDYFVVTSLKADPEKPSLLSAISWSFYVVIIVALQIIIEMKRFFLNRVDQRADDLIVTANKQLQDAVAKLKTHTSVNLEAHNIQTPEDHHPAQGLLPTISQLSNFYSKLRTQNKVLPSSEITSNFDEFHKGLAYQHQPAKFIKNTTHHRKESFELEEKKIVSAEANCRENVTMGEEVIRVQEVKKELDLNKIVSIKCSVAVASVSSREEIECSRTFHQRPHPDISKASKLPHSEQNDALQMQKITDSKSDMKSSRDQVHILNILITIEFLTPDAFIR